METGFREALRLYAEFSANAPDALNTDAALITMPGASDTKRLGNAIGAAGHLRQRPCSSRIN